MWIGKIRRRFKLWLKQCLYAAHFDSVGCTLQLSRSNLADRKRHSAKREIFAHEGIGRPLPVPGTMLTSTGFELVALVANR